MKIILTLAFVISSFVFSFAQNVEEQVPRSIISLSNIEFSIYPNPADTEFSVEFLLPRSQEMEMYLINLSGDKVKDLLSRQTVDAGVRTFEFNFPDNSAHGIYFIVIRSHGKSIIKKIEHKPRT